MKSLDKHSLITIAIIGTMAYTYMGIEKAHNKPVKVLGLDGDNSLKLVGAVTLLSAAALVYCCVLNKTKTA